MAYCTQADLEEDFGTENIKIWSDVEETGSVNTSRITTAIADADMEIDEKLFDLYDRTDLSATVRTINRCSRCFAGFNLYTMRGLRDNNTNEAMQAIKEHAELILWELRNGRSLLDKNVEEITPRGRRTPIAYAPS